MKFFFMSTKRNL